MKKIFKILNLFLDYIYKPKMKKFIILFMIFILVKPVFADVTPPEWSEFCPGKYLDAKYRNITFGDKLSKTSGWVIYCSIIGIPLAVPIIMYGNRKNKSNYWTIRKNTFLKEVNTCNQISNNDLKINCYIDLRKTEENRTNIDNGVYTPKVYVNNTNYNNNYSPYRYNY